MAAAVFIGTMMMLICFGILPSAQAPGTATGNAQAAIVTVGARASIPTVLGLGARVTVTGGEDATALSRVWTGAHSSQPPARGATVDESSLTVDPNSGHAVSQTPCATASLSPSNPIQSAGSTVNLAAGSTGCASPQYEFWVQYPSGMWYLKQGWGPATFNWDTSRLAPGTFTVHVWANQLGDSTDRWEAYGSSTVTLTGCTAASLTASPGSPQPPGTQVQFTATSTGCSNPMYEFWLQDTSGRWSIKGAFGTSAIWNWDTTGYPSGAYTVHVWANQTGGTTSTWQAFGELKYTLGSTTPPPPPAPCVSASLLPANPSQPAGSTVSFTATSTGCPNPVYKYWVGYPNGNWNMQRDFSTDPTWNWSTAGLAPGTYSVHVWANQAGDPTSSWEAYGSSTIALTGCTSASISPSAGSGPVGNPVIFTASSSGCPNPTYEFWLQDTSGSWQMVQTFGGGATWQWNTVGLPKGTYNVHVWANQQGADLSTWETYGTATYAASPTPSGLLVWAPPTLVNPITVTLCNCNLFSGVIIVNLAAGQDYILKDPVVLNYPVQIHGGHNIVWIGGDVQPTSGPDIGIQVGWGAGAGGGTIHLEGIYLHGYLTDGIEGGEYAGLSQPTGTLSDATLQVENIRIEGMTGDSTVTHQDCIQHYGGWRDLRVDHFTCHTPLQGFYLPWEDEASNVQGVLSHWDLRNANLYDMPPSGLTFQTLIHFGDRNGNFDSTTHQQVGSLSNVYLNATQRTFDQETYPNSGTRSTDGTIVHSTINVDGATWANTWAISGFVIPGIPPGGDYVPPGVAGLGYISPGYQ